MPQRETRVPVVMKRRSSEVCRQAIVKANSKAYNQALPLFDSSIKASGRTPLLFTIVARSL